MGTGLCAEGGRVCRDWNNKMDNQQETAEFFFRRSEEKYRKSDYAGSWADLDEAIRLAPNNPEYRLTRGDRLYFGDHYELAILDFEQYLAIVASDYITHPVIVPDLEELEEMAFVYRGLAVSYEALKRFQDAINVLDWLIDRGFGGARYYEWRGDQKLRIGDAQGAVADYTTAYKMENDDLICLSKRGQAYYRAEAYRQAIADFSEVLSRLANNDTWGLQTAYHYRGKAYYKLTEYDKALDDFNEALRLGNVQNISDATKYMRIFSPEDLP